MGSGASCRKAKCADEADRPSALLEAPEAVLEVAGLSTPRSVRGGTLPPISAEPSVRLAALPSVLAKVGRETDVGSATLAALLEDLDAFSAIPHQQSELREKWVSGRHETIRLPFSLIRGTFEVSTCESEGFLRQWARLWEVFWVEEGFLGDQSGHLGRVCSNFVLYTRVLWSYAELSPSVATGLLASGMVPCIATQIHSKELLEVESSRKLRFVLSALLSVLLACLRHNFGPTNLALRSNGAYLARLAELTKSGPDGVRLKAAMAFAYSASEAQQEALQPELERAVVEMLGLLSAAVEDGGRADGLSVAELLSALLRLAVYDRNAQIISQRGGLSILLAAMRSGSSGEVELAGATRVLWQMAFLPAARRQIQTQPDILHTLNRLKDHRSRSVEETARGALWTVSVAAVRFRRRCRRSLGLSRSVPDLLASIGPSHRHPAPAQPTQGPAENQSPAGRKFSELVFRKLSQHRGHIMISYSWDFKHLALPLNAALQSAGYNTWIDVEHVSGSVLESMAAGVEAASVVLLCLSDAYKASPSCRTEAEYVFRLRKPFVPIRMQANFVADGWLGALVGNQLRFEWTTAAEGRAAMPAILRELNARLSDQRPRSSSSEDSDEGKGQKLTDWTVEQTGCWLESAAGLPAEVAEGSFGLFTGVHLSALAALNARAPSAFFTVLSEQQHIPFHHILALSTALETLHRR